MTGASSGIGADLARELARDGYDLVVTGRRVEPMDTLAEELKAHGASTIVVAADLSQAGAAARLVEEIESQRVTIDVLINNAGVGAHGRFDQADPARLVEMLQVNIVALTELTRLLLPGMIARRSGRVMLVASTASFQPGPQMAVYFASKAYVLSLGEAIAYELRGTGVTITTVCPGRHGHQLCQGGRDREPGSAQELDEPHDDVSRGCQDRLPGPQGRPSCRGDGTPQQDHGDHRSTGATGRLLVACQLDDVEQMKVLV